MILKYGLVAAYGIMIIVVGIMGLKKTRSFNDYFLGGGKVGAIMTAFTYGTAYFSAVLFIGFAGKIGWGFGYSGLWIALTNAIIGVVGVWWFVGPRIKKLSTQMHVTTMAEFLEKRYNSKIMKFLAAISIFIFFVPYSAAVFMGLSYLFETNFHIHYTYALLSMGGLTALYLVMGRIQIHDHDRRDLRDDHVRRRRYPAGIHHSPRRWTGQHHQLPCRDQSQIGQTGGTSRPVAAAQPGDADQRGAVRHAPAHPENSTRSRTNRRSRRASSHPRSSPS